MAPEVINGQAYSSKADVWSLGVIFYEMLYGKTPYHANNIQDLYKKIKNNELIIQPKLK